MAIVYRIFSNQTLTSAGNVTSNPFPTGLGILRALQYELSTATTGTYVAATARIFVAANAESTHVTPVDSAGAANNVLLVSINSLNRYITYDNLRPFAPSTQLQLLSSTNNTITFDSVWLIYEPTHGDVA